MKKSDIKNGMHVITNDGSEYVIISGIEACGQIEDGNTANIVMVNMDAYGGWMSFDDYDDDLRFHDPEGEDEYDKDYDIKMVYAPRYYAWTLLSVHNRTYTDKFTKVWERPIPKKMTKAEIETELGYEIEIVD
jgi:hypothetical protein